MTTNGQTNGRKGLRDFCTRYVLAGAALGLLLFLAPQLTAQDQQDSKDQDSIGFSLGKSASPKEVGLPWYPGARKHKEDSGDTSSVQMSFQNGSSAFKLAVLELDSNDAPEKVITFYRQALSKYGKVLECTASTRTTKKDDESKPSKKLECDSDKPKDGGIELKAGTPQDQHIVGVDPNGSGSTIQLVYVKLPKDSDKD
jgi:hypothetical protein